MTAWIFLIGAILAEVVGTLSLRQLADAITPLPAVLVAVGYTASFLLMVPALKTINVGVSYAVWSAIGTTAIAVLGAYFFGDRLSAMGVVGIVVTLAGVTIICLSGTTTH